MENDITEGSKIRAREGTRLHNQVGESVGIIIEILNNLSIPIAIIQFECFNHKVPVYIRNLVSASAFRENDFETV